MQNFSQDGATPTLAHPHKGERITLLPRACYSRTTSTEQFACRTTVVAFDPSK